MTKHTTHESVKNTDVHYQASQGRVQVITTTIQLKLESCGKCRNKTMNLARTTAATCKRSHLQHLFFQFQFPFQFQFLLFHITQENLINMYTIKMYLLGSIPPPGWVCPGPWCHRYWYTHHKTPELTLVTTQQTQVCSQVIWEWGCIYQGTYHMLSHIASSMKLCPEYPGNEAPFCSRFAGYILLQPPSPSVSQPSSPSFQPTTKLQFLSYTSQFSQTTSDIEGSNSLVPRPSRMAWVQGLSIL